jgi:hypothetical protein
MKKLRVKFNEPVAVLADPRPIAELDRKYKQLREKMENREIDGQPKPYPESPIRLRISEMKAADRYGEPYLGFLRDTGFKPDSEHMINADLAEKWEASGVCMIIREPRENGEKKAA